VLSKTSREKEGKGRGANSVSGGEKTVEYKRGTDGEERGQGDLYLTKGGEKERQFPRQRGKGSLGK